MEVTAAARSHMMALGGGATPRAAAANARARDPQSAHDLGLAMGIPEDVLTAVEVQSGGSCDMTLEDLANTPDIFWMRALDQTRISNTGDILGIEDSRPLPPMMASKLTRWWRKAQVLSPPELPAPPPQKIKIITGNMAEEALPQ